MKKYIVKLFSRKELKNIRGGGSITTPDGPNDVNDAFRRCCRTDAPTVCSACKFVSSNAVCPTPGTFLTTNGC